MGDRKKLNSKQINWIRMYKIRTGVEATEERAELDAGKIGFVEFARKNVKWFEVWAKNTHRRIYRDIPEPEDTNV